MKFTRLLTYFLWGCIPLQFVGLQGIGRRKRWYALLHTTFMRAIVAAFG